MSLTKLFKSPMKLFAKDVITFFIIQRHDLGIEDKKLQYIAVKPGASVQVLRQKIWFILELPDYCEEVIILKTDEGVEVPLTELRKGNDPQHPYKMEVWLPGKLKELVSNEGNMLTMGRDEEEGSTVCNADVSSVISNETVKCNAKTSICTCIDRSTPPFHRIQPLHNEHRYKDNANYYHNLQRNYKQKDLTSQVSSTSLFFKLQSRKAPDNFANILLKIQSDLSTLSNKLTHLEEKIHS